MRGQLSACGNSWRREDGGHRDGDDRASGVGLLAVMLVLLVCGAREGADLRIPGILAVGRSFARGEIVDGFRSAGLMSECRVIVIETKEKKKKRRQSGRPPARDDD